MLLDGRCTRCLDCWSRRGHDRRGPYLGTDRRRVHLPSRRFGAGAQRAVLALLARDAHERLLDDEQCHTWDDARQESDPDVGPLVSLGGDKD